VWAVIYTKNRINVQGTFFFNIYSYDINNVPPYPAAQPGPGGTSYTTRWDYQMYNNPSDVGLNTGQTTLASGFRYLVYAKDEKKVVSQTNSATINVNTLTSANNGTVYTIVAPGNTGANWATIGAASPNIGCVFTKIDGNGTGNGTVNTEVNTSILIGNLQNPAQFGNATLNQLRDPYDIYPTIPHIALSAVVGATNGPQLADPTSVPVSQIAFGCTSGAITPTLDWTVEAIGWSAPGGENYAYTLQQ
jgi:hypothetical protein